MIVAAPEPTPGMVGGWNVARHMDLSSESPGPLFVTVMCGQVRSLQPHGAGH